MNPPVLGMNSREVECKKHGVIIIGIREDQFVLEFRLQKVRVLHRTICHLVCIPNIAPAEDNDGIPSPPGIAEIRVDLVEVERLVTQQSALLIPARIVVDGLEDDTINVDVALGQLLVDVAVDVFGDVDSNVECHAGEALLEGRLQSILLVRLVTAVPEGDNATLGKCSLVNLIQGSSLDLGRDRKLQESVVSGRRSGQDGGRGDNLWQNHLES